MCYSARIWHDYRKYVRAYNAEVSIDDFVSLFWRRRAEGASAVKVAKAFGAAFANPASEGERQALTLVREFEAAEAMRLEEELFKQRRRLADADRDLHGRTTKKATESRRAYFSPSWTAFQRDRGRDFSVMVDVVSV